MSLRSQLMTLALATLGALVTFQLLHRQLLGVLPAKGASDEVLAALAQSQADLRTLARSDAARSDEYHARFERLQELANRLRIVDHNREAIAARQQTLALGVGVVALLAFGVTLLVGARRDARRLRELGDALARLAAGAQGLRLDDRGGDHIGVIARMIERTSDAVSRDRQRLAGLRHLASWQEAARRQAHELRTPLTVARLELERLDAALAEGPRSEQAERSAGEVRTELQRVGELVRRSKPRGRRWPVRRASTAR
jgi:signal transduction histidine kinase